MSRAFESLSETNGKPNVTLAMSIANRDGGLHHDEPIKGPEFGNSTYDFPKSFNSLSLSDTAEEPERDNYVFDFLFAPRAPEDDYMN